MHPVLILAVFVSFVFLPLMPLPSYCIRCGTSVPLSKTAPKCPPCRLAVSRGEPKFLTTYRFCYVCSKPLPVSKRAAKCTGRGCSISESLPVQALPTPPPSQTPIVGSSISVVHPRVGGSSFCSRCGTTVPLILSQPTSPIRCASCAQSIDNGGPSFLGMILSIFTIFLSYYV